MATNKTISIVPAEWIIIKAVENVTHYQQIRHPNRVIMEVYTSPNIFEYYWVKPGDVTEYIGDYNGVYGVFGYQDRYKWLGDDGRDYTDEYQLKIAE